MTWDHLSFSVRFPEEEDVWSSGLPQSHPALQTGQRQIRGVGHANRKRRQGTSDPAFCSDSVCSKCKKNQRSHLSFIWLIKYEEKQSEDDEIFHLFLFLRLKQKVNACLRFTETHFKKFKKAFVETNSSCWLFLSRGASVISLTSILRLRFFHLRVVCSASCCVFLSSRAGTRPHVASKTDPLCTSHIVHSNLKEAGFYWKSESAYEPVQFLLLRKKKKKTRVRAEKWLESPQCCQHKQHKCFQTLLWVQLQRRPSASAACEVTALTGRMPVFYVAAEFTKSAMSAAVT